MEVPGPYPRWVMLVTAFSLGWTVGSVAAMITKLREYAAIMEQQQRDDKVIQRMLDDNHAFYNRKIQQIHRAHRRQESYDSSSEESLST